MGRGTNGAAGRSPRGRAGKGPKRGSPLRSSGNGIQYPCSVIALALIGAVLTPVAVLVSLLI